MTDTPFPLSVIIPNRNGLQILPRCVAFFGNMRRAAELIIVDNASDNPEIWPFYNELERRFGAKIIQYNQSFNYARMINIGVAAARRPFVLLLNNDVFITDPAVLEVALEHSARPTVGVVGSLLRYPDGTVQHAGIMLRKSKHGTCEVDHVLRFARHEGGEYPTESRSACEWQAVTGAFQMMRKSVFMDAGGYDEVNLPVEHNDVDFCLRVREMGLKVISLPLGGIIHDESYTRSKMDSVIARRLRQEARSLMEVRWGGAFDHDPFRIAYARDANPIVMPSKPKKTLYERVLRWRRRIERRIGFGTAAAQERGLMIASARAALPLRLQPGLSIVGPISSFGPAGEAARLVGRACRTVNIPFSYVDPDNTARERYASIEGEWEPYSHRLASLCLEDVGVLEATLCWLGEGRTRISYPIFHDIASIKRVAAILERFDEIWAASDTDAQVLRSLIKRPVRVMPLQWCSPVISKNCLPKAWQSTSALKALAAASNANLVDGVAVDEILERKRLMELGAMIGVALEELQVQFKM